MTSRRAALFLVLASAAPALAHVKWFSRNVELQDVPLPLREVATPTFFGLVVLSIAVVIGLTLLDDPLQRLTVYQRLRELLKEREGRAEAVMRVAIGMSLLLSWSANVVLAPDLPHELALVSWVQFAAILCLFDRRTSPVAGGLVWLLYAIGVQQFGLFHMLDYFAFLGVGFYLLFKASGSARVRAWVKPVLFGTTGLSLAWLALEKLVYPTWGLALLAQNPVLGLNLPPAFFLTSAAFVEFSLGFLLLLGVLGRPLAFIITLVFFLTTMVFGKHEVVGHLILHGVLIVFMLEGTSGPIAPPFRLHRAKALRVAFVGVNFAVLLGGLLFAYEQLARPRSLAPVVEHAQAPAVLTGPAPRVTLTALPSERGGWTLSLQLENFEISSTGKAEAGKGHVHLFVDGTLREMIFSNRHELSALTPGEHTLTVQLSTPDHQVLKVNGAPVESTVTVSQALSAASGS